MKSFKTRAKAEKVAMGGLIIEITGQDAHGNPVTLYVVPAGGFRSASEIAFKIGTVSIGVDTLATLTFSDVILNKGYKERCEKELAEIDEVIDQIRKS